MPPATNIAMVRREFVREALLQERASGKLRCNVCERRCLIPPGGLGWCRTRHNHQGRLVTLNYGAVAALAVDPIEKKPLYHFYPGSRVLTVGGWSCNFGCPWCLNWTTARAAPPAAGRFVSPDFLVALAVRVGCQGVAVSYNEPALSLEWSLEVFKQARQCGLFNVFVTNGYLTPEALRLLAEAGLDAINVDIKGDAAAVRQYCKGVDVEKVWATGRLARDLGLHLEVTTLVIPGVNDAPAVLDGIASRMAADLGGDIPWHITAYHPAYIFTAPPTPLATLLQAWQAGRAAGLEFVYLGNVRHPTSNDTRCPACGALLIHRSGFYVFQQMLSGEARPGRCPYCGHAVPGVFGLPGNCGPHSPPDNRYVSE